MITYNTWFNKFRNKHTIDKLTVLISFQSYKKNEYIACFMLIK